MLKNKHPNPIASSIRIELSQGFGWERGNVQVYGPGTLFQGMYLVLIIKTSDSLFNNNNKKAMSFYEPMHTQGKRLHFDYCSRLRKRC
jgi:hypothetical protein